MPYTDTGEAGGRRDTVAVTMGGAVGAPEPVGRRGIILDVLRARRSLSRDPPDRGKSGGNQIIISSDGHDRSSTRWCAPNELGPGASSRTGCRRTTVQGREGCKQGLCRADPRRCGLALYGVPGHPPSLPSAARPRPHSFSFTVTRSPRRETLSVEVERRRLPVGSSGSGPAGGTVRRTASGR